ncbi:MAG: RHS repeat-associated core domain-containing protein [Paludibacteraceae bacterium]
MTYDNLYNITSKKQEIIQKGVQFDGILSAGYELKYNYADNSQQISNIAESNYRVDRGTGGNYQLGSQTGDEINQNTSRFSYDANGNLLAIFTGTQANDSVLRATNERKMLWDEENRLLSVNDNGFVSSYWYDAAGERTVKESFDNEGVYVNGVQSAGRTGTSKFTAYISPYMVVSNGGNYTKHIYAGSQRITSKVSNSDIFSISPVNTNELQAKYSQLTSKIKERFDSLGVAYNGAQQTGGLISLTPPSGGWGAGIYFYHPDHLGSSSLITDASGNVTQHIEYVPYGEVFVEERNGTWHTPYLFNGKERDEETGLLYYGARYQDSKYGIWYSVDPLAEEDEGISSYVYCHNNPVNKVDPDGRWVANALGALASAAIDYGGQVAGNLTTGQSLGKALTDVSLGSIAISAVEGAINPISGVSKAALKATAKATIGTVVKTTLKEAGKSAAGQIIDNAISKDKKLLDDVGTEAVVGGLTGHLKKLAPNSPKANTTVKELNAAIKNGKTLSANQAKRLAAAKTGKLSNDLTKSLIDFTAGSNDKAITNISNGQKTKK